MVIEDGDAAEFAQSRAPTCSQRLFTTLEVDGIKS